MSVPPVFVACVNAWRGVAWRGLQTQALVTEQLRPSKCVPVFLSNKVIDLFYNGFSNEVLLVLVQK